MQKYPILVMVIGLTCVIGCGTTNPNQVASSDSVDYVTVKEEKEVRTVSNEELAAQGWQTTESGLKYRITREGNGKKPVRSDRVQVHYKGQLDDSDGREFDSSYKRGQPITFSLGGVIAGWTEGLTYVSEGGEIELIIPSELGYGARGSGSNIPPHQTLYFKVELISIQ